MKKVFYHFLGVIELLQPDIEKLKETCCKVAMVDALGCLDLELHRVERFIHSHFVQCGLLLNLLIVSEDQKKLA